MKKSELKKVLKPLIKECNKEVIFEEGALSGIITEVAKGLGNVNVVAPSTPQPIAESQNNFNKLRESSAVQEAKKRLEETKRDLQGSIGLQGVFENTKPLKETSKGTSEGAKYGSLRDSDPRDAGVNIDGILNLTGGWKL